ncbi:MAG: ABC transporter permease subunit [Brevinematales bacterium]|nr:ABC transporter permease subunit [Brevinematales bacterium]
MKFSPLTLRRIEKFKSQKRAYYSLILILGLYFFSLFADFIANDKPVILKYNGKLYFPIFTFYSGDHFGYSATDIIDYKKFVKSEKFLENKKNFAIFPPIPYSPYESIENLPSNPPSPPTFRNLLGTDDRGRDILTRIIYGFRISFSFALLITFVSISVGVFIGALQGYIGKWFDLTFQRIIEIISALPFLYIVIILGSSIGNSIFMLIIVFSFFDWIGISYYIRAEFYKIKEMPFVESARAIGVSDFKIMFNHILPNALTPVITFLPFDLIGAIFSLSALDFLGFGLPAPTPSIGELLRQGMANLSSYWLSIFPALFLFLILLLIAFVGEGIREAFNPRSFYKIE